MSQRLEDMSSKSLQSSDGKAKLAEQANAAEPDFNETLFRMRLTNESKESCDSLPSC